MEIYKNLLSNEFCDKLIERIKNECVLSESHKKNWYVWLIWGQQPSQKLPKEKWNDEIFKLINEELIKGGFDFRNHKPMWLQMTEYKNNRWLRKHIDGVKNKTFIIILSENFIGGDTFINDKKINLEKGYGVLFNGSQEFHEIKPVTEGVRYALNFWFY